MNEFTAYLFNKYFQSTLNRVDIVFDIYLDHSIMNSTRNKKGFRKQIEVAADMPIPRYWKSFLCVNENNMQLFQPLESELIQQANFKQLVATKYTVIVTNIASYLPSESTPYNHEEADTRIFVHVKEFVLKGHKVVLVDTVDTDQVVIAISCFNEPSQFGLKKLWIEFGFRINKRWIPIHDLASVLGIESAGLLLWYAFTGFMQFRRLEVKENNQCGQLRGCLTISHLSLKNTHTTADIIKSNMETFEFWKDLSAHFTAEQQHSKV